MRLREFEEKESVKVINGDSVNYKGKTFTQNVSDKRSGDKLVMVATDLLERLWNMSGQDWIIGKGPEYKNQISNRIATFKKFYDENDTIEVGNAAVRENGVFGFGDGRHRTRVLIELGYDYIPISMDPDSINNLKRNAQ